MKICVLDWGMSPSEFWKFTPGEFFMIRDSLLEDKYSNFMDQKGLTELMEKFPDVDNP